jgi:hypothetical protein
MKVANDAGRTVLTVPFTKAAQTQEAVMAKSLFEYACAPDPHLMSW